MQGAIFLVSLPLHELPSLVGSDDDDEQTTMKMRSVLDKLGRVASLLTWRKRESNGPSSWELVVKKQNMAATLPAVNTRRSPWLLVRRKEKGNADGIRQEYRYSLRLSSHLLSESVGHSQVLCCNLMKIHTFPKFAAQ
jgi:hypothetical protein